MKQKTKLIYGLVIILFFVIIPFRAFSQFYKYNGELIDEVRLEGLDRVDPYEVFLIIRTEEDSTLEYKFVNKDVKDLYHLGFFEDIEVEVKKEAGKFIVIFYFLENPILGNVNIKNNKEISTKKILDKIEMTKKEVEKGIYFSEYSAVKAKNTIIELYREKGYYNISVNYNIYKEKEENTCDFEIVIDEGTKLRISEIQLIGVEAFEQKEIMGLFKTKRKSFFRKGYLDQKKLEDDLLTVIDFYREKGFVSMRIMGVDKEFKEDKKSIILKVIIEEGKQFKFGKIEISYDSISGETPVYSKEEILDNLKLKEEELFSEKRLEDMATIISTIYSNKGYLFIKVKRKNIFLDETGRVDVKFFIAEGAVAVVRNVSVDGNPKTKDYVILRELTLLPGERYNQEKLQFDQRKLWNLGYFNSVFPQVKFTDEPDKVDIIWRVEEKPTGILQLSGGYSSQEEFIGMFEVGEMNLMGRGYKVSAKYEKSKKREDYRLSFTDPWFLNPWVLDKQLTVGFDVYRQSYNRRELFFEEVRTGFSVLVGRNFWKYYQASLKFRHEEVELIVEEEDLLSAPLDVVLNRGLNMSNSLSLSLSRSTLDYFFNPKKGTRLNLFFEGGGNFIYAGNRHVGIGGDSHYYSMIGEFSWYIPSFWKFILGTHVKAGYVKGLLGEPPPVYERFFLGGDYSIRGYEERGIGMTELSYARDNWEWRHVNWINDPSDTTDNVSKWILVDPTDGTYVDPYTGVVIDPETGKERLKEVNGNLYRDYYLTNYPFGGNRTFSFNLEYKFPLGANFWAAVFYDAGYVWSDLWMDVDGDGDLERVYSEPIAFNDLKLYQGLGFGIRFEIPFMGVMRLDWAFGLDHPTDEERGGRYNNSRIHFSIGNVF